MPAPTNILGRNQNRFFGNVPSADYPEAADARHENIIWRGTTVGATPTELFLGGRSGVRMVFDSTTNALAHLAWQAAAYDVTTPATSCGFFGNAAFTVIAGTVALVANSTNTKLPTAGTLALALTADNTNKAAIFTATGIAAETVHWEIFGSFTIMTQLGWVL